ncbi:MAG TPA: CGNR zinc finger domain-containing protein [Solirubrobacteraceae bacterium]|jgi:predicted RNA-binding Zn ribbon-like protein
MTGETQPGGRRPAPGELALVQAFINSHYDLELEHGADLFATPETLTAWLRRRGLLAAGESVGLGDARRAVTVREALRTVAQANEKQDKGGLETALVALDEVGGGCEVEVRFGERGPRLVPAGRGSVDRALAAVLAITARAMIDGRWERLKVCPGEDCGWAFYDTSRNQSSRWCSMAVCGGRSKARSHYRRHRGAGG